MDGDKIHLLSQLDVNGKYSQSQLMAVKSLLSKTFTEPSKNISMAIIMLAKYLTQL